MATSYRYQSRLDLACEPSAVRYARGHAEDTLLRWGIPAEARYDAVLVTAELVTNAVRHAGGEAEPFDPAHGQPRVRSCALTMWITARSLNIAVYDEDRNPPVLRPPSDDSENGRGLQLVAGLSEGSWGFVFPTHQPGKVVWARLRLPELRADSVGDSAHGRPGSKPPKPLDRPPLRAERRTVASA